MWGRFHPNVCRRLRAGLSRDLVPVARMGDPPSCCVLCTFAARGRKLSVRVSASPPPSAVAGAARVVGVRRLPACPGSACAGPGSSCRSLVGARPAPGRRMRRPWVVLLRPGRRRFLPRAARAASLVDASPFFSFPGDLERILPADVGLQKAGAHPAAAPFLCHGVDPKYQCDLVSRGGREVYPYPSPLHAVALQSPLFALTRETPQSEGRVPPRPPPASPAGPSSVRSRLAFEAGPAAAYIERLLRLRARGSERGPPIGEASPAPPQLGARKVDDEDGLEKPACTPGRVVVSGAASGDSLARPPPVPSVGTPFPSSHPKGRPGPSCGHMRGETRPDAPQLACGRAPAPRCPAQPTALAGWTGGGRWPSGRVDGCCAHPHLVASGASPTGPPKTRPVTVRRGPSDKTQGPGRPQLQWGALGVPRPPPESGGAPRRPTLAAEAPGRSCSESSLYPVSFFVPLLVARREGHRASAQALFPWEAAPLGASGGAARKRQRRWQSSVEISARARPDPGLGPRRPAARRGGIPRPVFARPRPPPPPQDTGARSASEGSEGSAECASLLLSTAAESSWDEASDHTASRFGDAESSGSDSGGGGRPGQRARASSKPALPPVPRLCRVKASKALKRKIRRFQPAALKVMTMV